VDVDTDLEMDGVSDQTLTLTVDFQKLLTGLDFKTQTTTHSSDNVDIATIIANNIPGAFAVEE
jgi:hypothetical protein